MKDRDKRHAAVARGSATWPLAASDSAAWKNEDETPNLAERLAADIGGWAVMLAARLSPPNGPFFAYDGRLLADASLFMPRQEEPLSV
jgi:hypothetical protein